MQPKRLTFPLLAALLTLLAVPAIAHASEPGLCPAPAGSPSYVVEVCAEVAAEEAKKAAEAAKKAGEQAPATFLDVTVRSHHGSSYGEPGRTDIAMTTSPYARITFTGDHGAGTYRFQQQLAGWYAVEEDGELWKAEHGPAVDTIHWSCHRRGQTVHYTVQAQGGSGPPLVRTGDFKIVLSARWCAAAKRRESSEEARQHAKNEAQEREERKEAAEKHQH